MDPSKYNVDVDHDVMDKDSDGDNKDQNSNNKKCKHTTIHNVSAQLKHHHTSQCCVYVTNKGYILSCIR